MRGFRFFVVLVMAFCLAACGKSASQAKSDAPPAGPRKVFVSVPSNNSGAAEKARQIFEQKVRGATDAVFVDNSKDADTLVLINTLPLTRNGQPTDMFGISISFIDIRTRVNAQNMGLWNERSLEEDMNHFVVDFQTYLKDSRNFK